MKKLFIVAISICFICVFSGNIFASSIESALEHFEKAEELHQQANEALFNQQMILAQAGSAPISENQILFRDIPWYTTRSEAEKLLLEQNAIIIDNEEERSKYLFTTVSKMQPASPSVPVIGAGYTGKYENLLVSNYIPNSLVMYYMYTIDDEGNINKSDEDALFYYGEYTFWSDDYNSQYSLYNDLKNKLISIYGEGVEVINEYDQIFTNWYDYEDNHLQMYFASNTTGEYFSVNLGYMAADAESKLTRLENALGYIKTSAVSSTYVEETNSEDITIQVEESSVKDKSLITFRGIPWYSTKAEFDSLMADEDVFIVLPKNDIYKIFYGGSTPVRSNAKANGGVCLDYSRSLTVAGYKPTKTCFAFIYEIDNNGEIIEDDELAKFYMGWYEFWRDDFEDHQSIFDDLAEKLSLIYGDGIEAVEFNYPHIKWMDSEGNIIQLSINSSQNGVDLVYAAADAQQLVEEMKATLDAIALSEEAAELEKNKEDLSGL